MGSRPLAQEKKILVCHRIVPSHDTFHYVLAEQFCSSKKFSFKSLHFKNPIRPTLVNVLQIGKIRLFVLLLMFYRFEWPSFALYQNVLQIRVARHCPLSKCSTDSTALTPIFPPLVKCSTDSGAPFKNLCLEISLSLTSVVNTLPL